jgi:hypothetical protein
MIARKVIGLVMVVLLWASGCYQGGDDPACEDPCNLGKTDDMSGAELDWLKVSATVEWSCGENEEAEPLGEGVVFDEDEWVYRVERDMALGPLTECRRSISARDPEAVCDWEVPSSCWSLSLSVGPRHSGAVVDFSAYAGDSDTNGGTSLALDYLRGTLPWNFEFSPDNASGIYGHAGASMVLQSCCKVCDRGKACGDTCIEWRDICQLPRGCACDG